MDLGFIVDSSDGVKWNELLSFVKAIIKSFDISVSGTHVAFVSFAKTAQVNFDFSTNPAPTYEIISGQINDIKPLGGMERRVDVAFGVALKNVFVTEKQMRKDARKVWLFFHQSICIYFCKTVIIIVK